MFKNLCKSRFGCVIIYFMPNMVALVLSWRKWIKDLGRIRILPMEEAMGVIIMVGNVNYAGEGSE